MIGAGTLRGVNEAARLAGRRTIEGTTRASRTWWGVVALFAMAGLLAAVGIVYVLERQSAAPTLATEGELDSRWGTYMSEREWGTPREAVGEDGWGLSWRGAIDTDYHYSDDAIAGITDVNNEFRLGWAFWDGAAEH